MLILQHLCQQQHKSCQHFNVYLFSFRYCKTFRFGDVAPCGNGLADVSQERATTAPPPTFMVEMSEVRIKLGYTENGR